MDRQTSLLTKTKTTTQNFIDNTEKPSTIERFQSKARTIHNKKYTYLHRLFGQKFQKYLEEEKLQINNARRTNVEKILEFLIEISDEEIFSMDPLKKQKLMWTIDKIQNNRLYEIEEMPNANKTDKKFNNRNSIGFVGSIAIHINNYIDCHDTINTDLKLHSHADFKKRNSINISDKYNFKNRNIDKFRSNKHSDLLSNFHLAEIKGTKQELNYVDEGNMDKMNISFDEDNPRSINNIKFDFDNTELKHKSKSIYQSSKSTNALNQIQAHESQISVTYISAHGDANIKPFYKDKINTMIDIANIKKRKKQITSITNKDIYKKNCSIFESFDMGFLEGIFTEFTVEDGNLYEKFLESGNMSNKIKENLQSINNSSFNIFKFNNSVGRKNTLPLIYYMSIYNQCPEYFQEINKIKCKAFIDDIYNGYKREVTYHNDLHGADLVQVISVWLSMSKISKHLDFKQLDIFCLLTSAAIHDYKHPGQNNSFHMNFFTDIALTFNDSSVLENYHISEAFKILRKSENDFIREFINPEEYKYFRRRMIDCVLATDMASHNSTMSHVQTKMDLKKKNGEGIECIIEDKTDTKKLFDTQREFLNMIIHLADLAHNSKTFDISFQWSLLLYEEFYQQGDFEKYSGKPYSFNCDRTTTNMDKSQTGFIKYVIGPSYELLIKCIPEAYVYFENVNNNLKKWEERERKKEIKEESCKANN